MRKIPVEIYSRVVGFFRPLAHWNPGKQEEKKDRHEYTKEDIEKAVE